VASAAHGANTGIAPRQARCALGPFPAALLPAPLVLGRRRLAPLSKPARRRHGRGPRVCTALFWSCANHGAEPGRPRPCARVAAGPGRGRALRMQCSAIHCAAAASAAVPARVRMVGRLQRRTQLASVRLARGVVRSGVRRGGLRLRGSAAVRGALRSAQHSTPRLQLAVYDMVGDAYQAANTAPLLRARS
jgi:hypothetical protein